MPVRARWERRCRDLAARYWMLAPFLLLGAAYSALGAGLAGRLGAEYMAVLALQFSLQVLGPVCVLALIDPACDEALRIAHRTLWTLGAVFAAPPHAALQISMFLWAFIGPEVMISLRNGNRVTRWVDANIGMKGCSALLGVLFPIFAAVEFASTWTPSQDVIARVGVNAVPLASLGFVLAGVYLAMATLWGTARFRRGPTPTFIAAMASLAPLVVSAAWAGLGPLGAATVAVCSCAGITMVLWSGALMELFAFGTA